MSTAANDKRKSTSVIFSEAMILAIHEGRKNQTRRIVRGGANLHCRGRLLRHGDGSATFGDTLPDDPVPYRVSCPYGTVGDLLWVKETFAKLGDGTIVYRADDPNRVEKWTTPIFLPRTASRMTLEILNVRCQRLRAVTPRDAVAEGIVRTPQGTYLADGAEFADARTAFFYAWDGIQESRGAWAISEADPFVWALTFRVAGSPS